MNSGDRLRPWRSRGSARAAGLAIAALLTLTLGSAAALAPAGPRTKGIGKSSAVGTRPLASAACVPGGIGCNATVTGELTADDCRLTFDQSFYDAWTFQGVAGQQVRITMTAGFDTYLFLLNPDGFIVEENGSLPIVYDVDETGTYTIWANSFEVGVTGAYSLQLLCSDGPGQCTAGPTTLCLNAGRFRVQVNWRVPTQGTSGVGMAVPLTSDTGYFWFFSSNNVELVIKVVDGRAFNNFFWVFYGALSDVEYTITVTDTETGSAKTYTNPQGRLASVADVTAFRPSGQETVTSASSAELEADAAERARAESREVTSLLRPSTALHCEASSTALCLNAGRFDVRVSWRVPSQGTSGVGMAVPLTSDTGYFWFFSSNNVELVIKVVDGHAFNGFFWVFYGALSDVEYTITVTDSDTARVKTYSNPQGQLASVADVAAFP